MFRLPRTAFERGVKLVLRKGCVVVQLPYLRQGFAREDDGGQGHGSPRSE